MFIRYTNRTVEIKDDNPQNPYNTQEFVKRMNQTVHLFDEDYEGPAKAYSNALVQDATRYNNFLDLCTEMSKQFTYLCGALKSNGLSVSMPDYEVFLQEYEKIKKYNDRDFVMAIQKEVKLLEDSMRYSIDRNIKTAKTYGIPLTKPNPNPTLTK